MTHCVGFPFVARSDARVLILGSLPGVESLKQQQYYAKKQNSFWRIMGELIGASPDVAYDVRLKLLRESGIALWDVCAEARRDGSLDAHIRLPQTNDFVAFFKNHPKIKLICFNGRAAEKLFRQHVMPVLPRHVLALPSISLPSTSPAHAGMRFEEKLSRWGNALASHVGVA